VGLSAKQVEHFKQLLQTRIADLNSMLAAADQETRASAARHADPADQAAAEYERQAVLHKSNTAREIVRALNQALERLRQGNFGECAAYGGDIEAKRLEVIPWARYCVTCQEAREHS
jgi:DnaK suppressor protein